MQTLNEYKNALKMERDAFDRYRQSVMATLKQMQVRQQSVIDICTKKGYTDVIDFIKKAECPLPPYSVPVLVTFDITRPPVVATREKNATNDYYQECFSGVHFADLIKWEYLNS